MKDANRKLRNIEDAIIESIMDLPDGGLEAELREAGEDPDEIVRRVVQCLARPIFKRQR